MVKETISLHIHTHLREDALILFGFYNREEKNLFRELLRVSAIGPKLALSILSGIHHRELINAICQRDLPKLQKIPGVGKKTAERVSIELADRLSKNFAEAFVESQSPQEDWHAELESVLMNLGYQRQEIQKVLQKIWQSNKNLSQEPLEGMVKHALGELTKPKTMRMQ